MRPYFLGIAGGSASGKSWLAGAVHRHLGPERCARIEHDRYYHPLPPEWHGRAEEWDFDAPAALETELLVEHLAYLAVGRAVDVPVYAFDRHDRLPRHDRVEPRPVVVVEGILVLAEPALRDQLDLAVFVDAPPEVRLARRVERDVRERGRTSESVRERFLRHVEPAHQRYVEPTRAHAHMVLDGEAPLGANVEAVLEWLPSEVR